MLGIYRVKMHATSPNEERGNGRTWIANQCDMDPSTKLDLLWGTDKYFELIKEDLIVCGGLGVHRAFPTQSARKHPTVLTCPPMLNLPAAELPPKLKEPTVLNVRYPSRGISRRCEDEQEGGICHHYGWRGVYNNNHPTKQSLFTSNKRVIFFNSFLFSSCALNIKAAGTNRHLLIDPSLLILRTLIKSWLMLSEYCWGGLCSLHYPQGLSSSLTLHRPAVFKQHATNNRQRRGTKLTIIKNARLISFKIWSRSEPCELRRGVRSRTLPLNQSN